MEPSRAVRRDEWEETTDAHNTHSTTFRSAHTRHSKAFANNHVLMELHCLTGTDAQVTAKELGKSRPFQLS